MRTLHSLSGQPVPVFDHHRSKKVHSCVQMEFSIFQFVSITSCCVGVRHLKDPGSVFFIPSHQIFIAISSAG